MRRSSDSESVSPSAALGSVCLRHGLERDFPAWAGAGRGARASGLDEEGAVAADAERLTRLEAVLLVSREPLASRKLSQYANLADGTEARTLIRHLNARYDAAGRAFRVEEVAGGYQLLTRPQFAPWLRRLAHVPREMRLSPPAMETLAVVAYRQPVLKAEADAIRGVNCGEILRQLMERDLVRIGGRSEELGRPFLYATTRRFLNLFGLQSLDDLPRGGTLSDWTAALSGTSFNKASAKAEDDPETLATDRSLEEESNVSVTLAPTQQELLDEHDARRKWGTLIPRAAEEEEEEEEDVDDDDDDDEDDDEEDLDEEDDDLDDDFDDEEDDLDDEEDEEDEEEEEEEDDLEEADWKEVDDEDDDEEEDEEDDDEDDEDDDWDEDEEEEEEDEAAE